jgi:hypothetical protein
MFDDDDDVLMMMMNHSHLTSLGGESWFFFTRNRPFILKKVPLEN